MRATSRREFHPAGPFFVRKRLNMGSRRLNPGDKLSKKNLSLLTPRRLKLLWQQGYLEMEGSRAPQPKPPSALPEPTVVEVPTEPEEAEEQDEPEELTE